MRLDQSSRSQLGAGREALPRRIAAPPGEIGPLMERSDRVVAGLDPGREGWRQLGVLNQLGVTRGTLQLS